MTSSGEDVLNDSKTGGLSEHISPSGNGEDGDSNGPGCARNHEERRRAWRSILGSRLGGLNIIRNYTTVFIGHSTSAILTLLTSIFLARVLSKADFGTYSVFVAMAVVFSSAVDIGMTSTLVRFGSRLHSEGNHVELSRIVRATIVGKVVIGIAVGVVGFLVMYILKLGNDLDSLYLLALVPATGLLLSFFFMTQGILQIGRNFGKISILLVAKGLLFLCSVILVALVGELGIVTVCFLLMITTLLAVTLFSGQIRDTLRVEARWSKARWKDVRFLLGFGKYIAIAGLAFSLFERIPITAILNKWGPESAADFSVAITIVSFLAILSVPLTTVLLPDLSRIRSDIALRKYMLSTYRLLLPLALLVLVGFIGAAKPLISLLYGAEYADAAPLLSILAVPFVLTFALLPISLSLTFVFNRPDIASMTNVGQLLVLLAALVFVGRFDDVTTLVILYGAIRGGGSVVESTASVMLMRSRKGHSNQGVGLAERLSPDLRGYGRESERRNQ